ncbi:hypothetical protein BGZ81_002547, partial [Podila clonocystis]
QDSVSTVLHRYEQNPEVQAAKARYNQQEEAIRLEKPVNIHAACRVYVDGKETPLTKAQTDGKRLTEHLQEQHVHGLKSRLVQASRTRREVIKSKKSQALTADQQQQLHCQRHYNRFKTMDCPSVQAPPPLPLYSLPQQAPPLPPPAPAHPLPPPASAHPLPHPPPAHQLLDQRQQQHQETINRQRQDRPTSVSTRAEACKKEHKAQGFDKLKSKRYGIRVRMVQPQQQQDNVSGDDGELPEGLVFKPFKPYTSVSPIAPKKTQRHSTYIPKDCQMTKQDVVKSITGFHQITTLSVGQLGRNIGHTVLPQCIPTNDPVDVKMYYAAKAGIATTETIQRIVRVANALLRHGQKALALFIASATSADLHRLKDTIFHKHRHCTVEVAISEAARKRLGKLGKVNNSNSTETLATIEAISEQGEEQEQDSSYPEEEADESGTKGDHGGFFGSLLQYMRTPTATIKYNNRHIALIRPIRTQYIQACPLDEAEFKILNHGLESSIVQTIGASLAVQNIRHYIGLTTGEDPSFIDISTKPPGWLLTHLITPVGGSLQSPVHNHMGQAHNNFARITTTATVEELNVLREAIRTQAIGNESSSQFLMDRRPNEDHVIINPKPGQPTNLLPSYLLRGMIVTDGRSLHLSAINLQLRKGKRFMTELTTNSNDGMVYRHHVLAPDPHRCLPSLTTAIPDQAALSQLFPDVSKVDVGAIDLGKEFMAAFTCRRYDRPDFVYTVHAKTKALYQPTNKAAKELERCLDNSTVTHVAGNESAISVYQSALPSLRSDPKHRVLLEQTDEYQQYAAFYNNHGRQQKRKEQAKRARCGEFDVLTNHILTAMGTHRARSLGYIVLGIDEYYTSRRCPSCKCSGSDAQDFVGYIGLRRTYCSSCRTWFHRDLLAASNMVEAGRYYLQHLSRPAHLLPISEDGKWVYNPWYGPVPPPEVPTGQLLDRRALQGQGKAQQMDVEMQDATAV